MKVRSRCWIGLVLALLGCTSAEQRRGAAPAGDDQPSPAPGPAPAEDAATVARPDGPRAAAPDAAAAEPAPAARDASAAAPDTRAPDAASAPVATVDCKTAKLCDDFEAYPAGAAPQGAWKATTGNGGTLTVDTSKAWSGTKSLHITTPGGGARAVITQGKPLLPLEGNNLYGRMMMFFVQPPFTTHYTLVRASGPLPGGGNATYSLGGFSKANVLFNYQPGDLLRWGKGVWPANQWTCVQWQFDGGKDEARVWLDGQPLTDMTVSKATKDWPAPSFQTLAIGFENCCASDVKVQLWIDDVAVDDKPIDCPKKP